MKQNQNSTDNNDNEEITPLVRFINAKSAKEYVEVIRDLSSAQKIETIVTCWEDNEHSELLGDFELQAKVEITYKKEINLIVQIMKLNDKQYFSLQSDIKEYNLITIDSVLIFVKTAQFLTECNMGMLN